MSARSTSSRGVPARWWVILLFLASGCAQRAAAPREWRSNPVPLYPERPQEAHIHVVKPGETLSSIGAQYRISIDEIARLNAISDPNQLRIGQRLKLHARAVDPKPVAKAPQEVHPRRPVKRPDGPKVACEAHGPAPRSWSSSREGFVWPVDGLVVTRFGKLEGKKHEGLAIGAPQGTPVWASATGKVVLAGKQQGYGQLVVIEHDKGLLTVYGSLDRACVKSGEKVRRGALLGLVGDSKGVASPRLYFELRNGDTRVDPWPRLP